MKVFQTINKSDRISSIDISRSFAIISIVLFHFNNKLPYGYLGVDLFFVTSGLLVGGLLTKDFYNKRKINFLKFVLQRGFKIWPSYYFFIFIGNIVAFIFYNKSNPDQIIPIWDLKRYLFFYQNYTGLPLHWSFNHVWSLCVEEHFYILLPILFLFVQFFITQQYQLKSLFIFVILTITAGILFKYFSFYLTNSKDSYSATHNRIDALAWGVLLNLIINYFGNKLKSFKFSVTVFAAGITIFVFCLYVKINSESILYANIYFPSSIPFSFFLMILGIYFMNLSNLKVLRFIAYYSYNWYLWHPIFIIIITKYFGNTIFSLLLYLVVSFSVAVITTIFIEEPFLEKRKVVLQKIFSSKNKI